MFAVFIAFAAARQGAIVVTQLSPAHPNLISGASSALTAGFEASDKFTYLSVVE